MTPDQLKFAIERRGYSVRVETGEGWVTFHVRKGDVATNPTYSKHDLAMSKVPLTGFVNAMLYRLSGTMHPLWCKSCHEPLAQGRNQSCVKCGALLDGNTEDVKDE